MYLYSAYAPQLASQLSLTTTSSSFIGMVGNLGMALSGPFAGVIVDKYGPKIPTFIGGLGTLIGYSIIKKCFLEKIDHVGVLAAALLVVGAGSTFTFSSIVKCAAVNFPNARGFATSVPMAAFGLSAFFLSTFASALYPGDTYKFLHLLSIVPTALFYLSIYFIRFPDNSINSAAKNIPSAVDNQVDSGGIELRDINSNHIGGHSKKFDDEDDSKRHDTVDIYGSELLKNRTFWSHFIVMGLLAGIGQMYIYSCGYIVRALLGGNKSGIDEVVVQQAQSVQVGIISLSSFSGRLISGSLSDFLTYRYKAQRTWLLVGAGAISSLAQVAGLTVMDVSHLWMSSIATGIAYGICYGSYPTIVGDSFGMNHFSQNWGLLALSPLTASYTFNMLFGYYYDINSVPDGEGHQTCVLGRQCYSSAFKVTILGTLFAVFMALEIIIVHKKPQR